MADAALIAVMAIWGSTFALLRFFLGGAGSPASASPLMLVAARMALASGLLAAFLAATAQGRSGLRALGSLRPGSLLRDGLLCGVLLGSGFALQIEGLQRTTASRSGFFTGLLVVFTPLFEFALLRKRPGPASLAGVALALAGLSLLSSPLQTGAVGTALGDALTIGCAAVFSLHILVLGRVARRHPVLPLLLVQLVATGLIAGGLSPLVERGRFAAEPRLLLALGYLAVFATLLTFGVQTWAQRRVSPVRMALLSSLEPVFAALWAALFLGEALSLRERLGGGLVVLGVAAGEVGTALLARLRSTA